MKTITNTSPLRRMDGGSGAENHIRSDLSGEMGDASIADLIRVLIMRIPTEKLKMGDVHCGTKILELAEKCKKTLEIEDSDFTWLQQAVNSYSPVIFGMNAVYLDRALKEAQERKPANG